MPDTALTHDTIRATTVKGTDVYNADGEHLGHIDDIVIGKRDGHAEYAIMSFGGFLGIGEKFHPLPWESLTYDTDRGGYVVSVSREQLEGAPSYGLEDEPDWNDPDYGRRVRGYYGYPVMWVAGDNAGTTGIAAGPGTAVAVNILRQRGGHEVTKIIGISGSLRRESYNTSLLQAAVALAPPGVEIVEASIRGIPLYDGDLEAAEGIPQVVSALKEAIVAADGLLMVTPEYNNSIPGVFKNAIDWLSRPSADIKRVFGGRCVGLIGCSNGPFATTLSQAAWLPVLRTLGTIPYFGTRLVVPRGGSVFDAEGALVSEEIRDRLQKYLEGFADFVEQQRRVRSAPSA